MTPKLFPSDGVASFTAILHSLKTRIGDEEYSRVGLGSYSVHQWLREHKEERPEFRRAYCELWAWEFHRYSGDYQRACEYMKQEGYHGIYWRNDMW